MDERPPTPPPPPSPPPGYGQPRPPERYRPRPPRRNQSPGTPVTAALALAFAGLLLFLTIAAQLLAPYLVEEPPPAGGAATTAEAPEPFGMFQLTAQYSIFAARPQEWASFMPPPKESDLNTVMSQLNLLADSEVDELRATIVEAEVKGPESALERLDKYRERLREAEAEDEQSPSGLTQGLLEDAARLETIYTSESAEALSDEDAEALRDRHGWFGTLAVSFGRDSSDPLRAEAMGPTKRIGFLVVGAVLGIVAAGILGFGLLITAIVLAATRKLRLRFIAIMPGGSVGLETFAIFLAGFWVVQFVVAAAGLEKALPLIIWSLALVPLWPLVRGWSWNQLRESLGWHAGRGVLREIGAGIVGYIAGLPVIALGVVAMLALMALWTAIAGSGPEPPSHPLPDELAKGGLLQIVSLVVLATMWAPLVEESIFRGALYDELRGRFSGVASALLTGFIFAAVHPQGFLAWPALGSIGFVLAMLREWRGSLIASITAHALNNGVVVTLLLVAMS